jgi:DNA-binding transcriptional MerR regulator
VNHSLDSLADAVNAWCDRRSVRPANGQASTELTVRTLRYYRTVNLLDTPTTGGGQGYGERHFLQACAVRVLQAQGLPLSRIQALLFGRSDGELREVVQAADSIAPALSEPFPFATQAAETWHTWALAPDVMLVSRGSGMRPTPTQIEAIQKILRSQ